MNTATMLLVDGRRVNASAADGKLLIEGEPADIQVTQEGVFLVGEDLVKSPRFRRGGSREDVLAVRTYEGARLVRLNYGGRKIAGVELVDENKVYVNQTADTIVFLREEDGKVFVIPPAGGTAYTVPAFRQYGSKRGGSPLLFATPMAEGLLPTRKEVIIIGPAPVARAAMSTNRKDVLGLHPDLDVMPGGVRLAWNFVAHRPNI